MPRRVSKVPSVLREEQGMHREGVGSVDGLSWGQGGVGYLKQVGLSLMGSSGCLGWLLLCD